MRRTNLALALALLALSGCRGCTSSRPPIHPNPNMYNQPRYEPQAASAFFYNGQAMRPPVPGTVARGELRDLTKDGPYWTGKDAGGMFVTAIPKPPQDEVRRNDYPVDYAERGKQRFEIYCAACHDKGGDGKGILFERGKVPTPSFHTDKLLQMPDGQIFDTITNGTGLMPAYRYPIPVRDRWAIIVYLRALQAHRLARSGRPVPAQVQPAPPAAPAPTSPQPVPPQPATPQQVKPQQVKS
ncbi:MAG: quinol:cytochrome C oxidoreductase [Acidobacteria bacterium]|nr:MAG: quinol:cytochrome C oxidoreductase [Acidobacteriota bacterium]